MYRHQIGVSVLTNGSDRPYLERCLDNLLHWTDYRPLVLAVFDNGSTDDTWFWLQQRSQQPHDGVSWRLEQRHDDRGCAFGTNHSISMLDDCELQLHLESDFYLIDPSISGVSTSWLQEVADRMHEFDYVYLRRMRDEKEILVHSWAQWQARCTGIGPVVSCPGFWWSNNPALFRTAALRQHGTLPLNEGTDGPKGTPGWSRPELQAKAPPRVGLHRWGMFAHETELLRQDAGCGVARFGNSLCKYGLFVDPGCAWCRQCRRAASPNDMLETEQRFRANGGKV